MYKSQYIGGQKEKFVRLDDLDSTLSMSSDTGAMKRCGFSIEGLTHTVRPKHNPTKSFRVGVKRGSEGLLTFGRSLRSNVTRAVFSEDLHISEKNIFDPQDKQLLFWNKLLILLSLLSVSIDPLFFYLPVFDPQKECLTLDGGLSVTTIFLRTVMDVLFVFRILLQFRTAYIAPSSRVFGRGELVIDPTQIAKRYLQRYFVVDFLSVLPLPQIVVFRHLYLPNADASTSKHALVHLVVLQAIPRFIRIYPIFSELKKSAGTLTEGAWTGAAFYLLSYILFSHILGALWYFFSVERKYECWEKACSTNEDCQKKYLYCHSEQVYDAWERIRNDTVSQCSTDNEKPTFNYGIYTQAISSQIVESTHFFSKLCYCLWWGLQNLSTLGQGLETSTYYKEVLFSIALAISGLILFALLIGNMQTYLQSLTVRLEEMRVKRRDSEQWMHHRLLPQELRERVRRYDQYKWLETRGVDEESIVQSLPKDLRRDIKRHLCLNLVRRVPLFANMDERLLDAICERLKPSLYTEHTYIIREGDPVEDMLFIIRGRLESITTDGGRSGFFNRGVLKEADFCGEELLTWALDPKAGSNLPSSTRTVMALTEVEAFALEAEELKFVASQYRRLHSRQIQHTFRFYSQQWRTWAAVFIQAAWRRYSKRKRAEQYRKEEEEEEEEDEYDSDGDEDDDHKALVSRSDSFGSTSIGATVLASRFAANAIRGHKLRATDSTSPVKLQKPSEPDFSNFII